VHVSYRQKERAFLVQSEAHISHSQPNEAVSIEKQAFPFVIPATTINENCSTMSGQSGTQNRQSRNALVCHFRAIKCGALDLRMVGASLAYRLPLHQTFTSQLLVRNPKAWPALVHRLWYGNTAQQHHSITVAPLRAIQV
jgi:hypothetical protein